MLMKRGMVAALVGLMGACSSQAILLGQVDDFQDTTLMNWGGGAPQVNLGGGAGGASDRYMEVESSGTFGTGSHWAIFNTIQWGGPYSTAGVNVIGVDVRNFGSNALHLRAVVFGGPFDSRWISQNAHVIPGNSGWQRKYLVLTEGTMQLVQGSETWPTVIGAVNRFMFRHNTAAQANGQVQALRIGLDNITALDHVPSPPDFVQVNQGQYGGGGIAEIVANDEQYYFVQCDVFASIGEAEYRSHLPMPAFGTFRYQTDLSADRDDLLLRTSFWDFNTNGWVVVDTRNSSVSDQAFTINTASNFARFVRTSDLEVRSRNVWVPQADYDASDGWFMNVDFVKWSLVP